MTRTFPRTARAPQPALPTFIDDAPQTMPTVTPGCVDATARDAIGVDDVAALLGVGRRTVYTAVAHGVIPHLRSGRRIVFDRTALVRWLTRDGRSTVRRVT